MKYKCDLVFLHRHQNLILSHPNNSQKSETLVTVNNMTHLSTFVIFMSRSKCHKKNLQDHESHLKLIVRAGGHHEDPEVLQWPRPTEPNYIREEKGDLLTSFHQFRTWRRPVALV